MGSRRSHTHILRATLYEVERGLFQVSYRTDGADRAVHDLPIYQTGTCASDAQQRVEETAQACGFDLVMWGCSPEVSALVLGPACETALPTAGTPAAG